MMKIFFTILTVLIIASEYDNSTALMDTLNQSDFTDSEKEDIVKIVDFFESKINVSENEINNAYKVFIQELMNEGSLVLHRKFNYVDLRKMLANISSTTKSEIWSEASSIAFYSYNGKKLEEPINYKSLVISTNGKYIELLEKTAKKDEKVNHYVSSAKEAGDFPMFINLTGLLVGLDNKWVDFNEGQWRLIVSIQILTMLENNQRHIELTK